MKMVAAIVLALLGFVQIASAESHWTFELSGGSAINFETRLKIQTAGDEEIEIDADYETRGFEGPLYYAWRIGRSSNSAGWEFEFIHHKIFLQNTSDVVQGFAISHGYNMLMGNRIWILNDIFVLRAGGGAVLAHPESRISDVSFEPGYELTGPVGQVSVGTRLFVSTGWFIQLESKFTIAGANVTLAGGEASAPNVALHFLAGLGYRL